MENLERRLNEIKLLLNARRLSLVLDLRVNDIWKPGRGSWYSSDKDLSALKIKKNHCLSVVKTNDHTAQLGWTVSFYASCKNERWFRNDTPKMIKYFIKDSIHFLLATCFAAAKQNKNVSSSLEKCEVAFLLSVSKLAIRFQLGGVLLKEYLQYAKTRCIVFQDARAFSIHHVLEEHLGC